MSQVSQPLGEQLTQHPLDAVVEQLESLLEKLRMELDVAPSDRTAHQDLLRRIIQASESGLQVPAQTYPKSSNLPQPQVQELTEEGLKLLNSLQGISEGKIGEDIDVDAMNKRLKERGYQIQLSFPETPAH
jgi:hypothetical protein